MSLQLKPRIGSDGAEDAFSARNEGNLESATIIAGVNNPKPRPNYDEISVGQETMFLLCVCLQQLLSQAGVSQTINPTMAIAKVFGVEDNPGEQSWFTAAYSLTVGTFILIAGRLGDMYGYKRLYLIGFVWFGLSSLVAGFVGFTTSSIFFDVMRALQGIGPAISMPNAIALIGHYYPNGRKKNLCMCLYGGIAPGGFVVGALFSGLFAVKPTEMALDGVWLSFFVMAIACFMISVVAYLAIPSGIGNHQAKGEKRHFDYLGATLGVAGLILINFSWNQGPTVGWEKAYVYVLLIVGFILLGLFYMVELRVQDPIVPADALKGDTGFVLGCIAAGWSCFGVWLYYSFRWAENVDKQGPVTRAVEFIPAPIGGYIAAFSTGILLETVPLSVVMLMAMTCFLVGIIIMGTRPVGQIYWAQKFVSILVQCFGMDMSFPAGTLILSNSLPKSQQGIAASLVATFQNYAILIGLGIAGTVEKYHTKGLPDNQDTTVEGYRVAFYMGMGLAGCGVVLSLVFLFTQVFNSKRTHRLQQNDEKEPGSDDLE